MSESVASVKIARRLGRSGKIIHNDRSSIFDCLVLEFSATSAVLELPSTLGVPRSFHLRIKPSEDEYICDLTWRTDRQIGVTCRRPATMTAPPSNSETIANSPLPARIRRVPFGAGLRLRRP